MKRIFSIAALLIFMFSMTAFSQQNTNKEKPNKAQTTTTVDKKFVDANGDGLCDTCGKKAEECTGDCKAKCDGKEHKQGEKKCDSKVNKEGTKSCGEKKPGCCGHKAG